MKTLHGIEYDFSVEVYGAPPWELGDVVESPVAIQHPCGGGQVTHFVGKASVVQIDGLGGVHRGAPVDSHRVYFYVPETSEQLRARLFEERRKEVMSRGCYRSLLP